MSMCVCECVSARVWSGAQVDLLREPLGREALLDHSRELHIRHTVALEPLALAVAEAIDAVRV